MIRKTHKKSRRGCVSCKRRRVKCGEQKPSCSSCTTRGFDCTYVSSNIVWMDEKAKRTPERDIRQSDEGSPLLRAASNKSHDIPFDTATMTANLNLEGLELILHWFTATAQTVAGNPDALHIVQTVILKQAMTHHFLLHGILALSALHLASSYSGRDSILEAKYTRIATAHHNKGLTEYQSVLEEISEVNYSATIAFSSITVIYAFAQSRPMQGVKAKGEVVDDLVQISMLGRGWEKVVSLSRDLSCNASGDLMPVAKIPDYHLPVDTEAAFSRLHELNAEKSQNSAERDSYTTAINSLKAVFGKQATPEGATNPHTAGGWTDTLQNEFVGLLRERRPLALVITGYYCVVLDRVPEVWWLSGWSQGLFGVIWSELEPEYRKEVDWARGQIQLETPNEAMQISKL